MTEKQDMLSLADFLVVLVRYRWQFIGVWVLVMALVVTYLAFAEKSWRLTGTIYVGRFQNLLLEEGEFVAHKLEDYSFIKRALDGAGIKPDIPVTRLTRLVRCDVLNEIKKIDNVGQVKLTVEYKDQQMTYEIFKAITDQLIAEHQKMLDESVAIFDQLIEDFNKEEQVMRENLKQDEAFAYSDPDKLSSNKTVPTQLLAHHTVGEKRFYLKDLVKDVSYLKIEGHSATRSFVTRLAAAPEVPDEHFKPKGMLTLLLGAVFATMAATLMALALELWKTTISPALAKK